MIWRNSQNSPFLLVLDALLYSDKGDYTILQDLINIKADIYTYIPRTINTPLFHIAKNGKLYQIPIFKLLLENVDISNELYDILLELLNDGNIPKLGYIIVLLLEKIITVDNELFKRISEKLFEKISEKIFDNLQETGLAIYNESTNSNGERYEYYKVIIDNILNKIDTSKVYDLLGIFFNYYKQ